MNPEVHKIIDQIKNESNFFTKAHLLEFLRKQYEVPVKDLAQALSLQSSSISHILRLNKLPDIMIDGYSSQMVSISHLFIIARLSTHEQMMQAYEKVLADSLNTAQTEVLVRDLLYHVSSKGTKIEKSKIDEVRESIGKGKKDVQVKVVQTRIKGTLSIEVKGNLAETTQELEKFLTKLNK